MTNHFPTPEIGEIVVFEGSVYALGLGENVADALSLHKGGSSVPFTRDNAPAIDTLLQARGTEMDLAMIGDAVTSSPAEANRGERFACWVNHLVDWSLAGSETVQLMMVQNDTPTEFAFARDIAVKGKASDLHFQTEIATHRADAELIVTVTGRNGKTRDEKVVAFDPAYRGGQLAAGYQKVRIALPEAEPDLRVSVALRYKGYLDDGSGSEAFMFLTRPRVAPLRQREPLTVPVRLGDANGSAGQWYSAPVPAPTSPTENLDVEIRGTRIPVMAGIQPGIELVEEYGHTLVFRSDQPQTVVLSIDGKLVERLHITEHNLVLRVPARYLNGTRRSVALLDGSGTQVLWKSLVLLPSILTPADIIQRETPAPYPVQVFPQTARRYESLKRQMAHAGPETDLPQLAHTLSILEGGYERVKLKPLHFPQVDAPDVSIVIPAHNKIEVTYLGLCSLLLAHNAASFEVILVDDASSDETAEIESFVSGISVVRNSEAQRFIRACNAGAEQARGKYIVLLNNDVEVTSGWLDELIAAFSRFDNVGLVGSKLLYPNGLLQDAGGIIWGSGNPWNYGNRQNPDEPRFSYARQADYLSGAAMMVPAKLWKKLGGLSSYLEPMYFEDTDFSFKVREAGYSTWFVPSSEIYHYEGMTSGTDVTKGFKRFQEVNRPKFKRRWARAYANHGKEGHRPDLEKDRGIVGRVLFVDYTTIRPDQDAGSYAALQEIRLVQSLGYKVSFLPTNMAHLGSYTEALQKAGVEVIYAPFFLSPGEYLERHARDFDAFYITRFYVAQETLSIIRSHAPRAKVLFNNADLHFLREIRTARAQNDPNMLEQARQTRDEELAVINGVDVVLSYNDVEHSVIQAYTDGAATVVKCPWVVDSPRHIRALEKRSGLSFLGGFRHHPNVEGIVWFVETVMPLVNAADPDLALTIYGSGMTGKVKLLKSETVLPKGFVENLSSAFDRHRIFIAPLLSGAGIKGKVLSALAHGIPCVLTPTAAEGIGLRHGMDCMIAETPQQWVEAITRLQGDDALWHKLSSNARDYMKSGFSFDVGRDKMRAAFEAADLFRSLD